MNTTYLSLYFYDNPDPKIFYLQDVSVYNPDIKIETPYLDITPPNFSTSFTFEYPPLTTIPVNSNLFKWTNTLSYEGLTDLPDGLYVINQSVKPNCSVEKSYNYFRITKLKTKILEYLSDKFTLESTDCLGCSREDSWYKELFQYLQWLDTAKYMAEQSCKVKEATIIYNNVKTAIDNLEC